MSKFKRKIQMEATPMASNLDEKEMEWILPKILIIQGKEEEARRSFPVIVAAASSGVQAEMVQDLQSSLRIAESVERPQLESLDPAGKILRSCKTHQELLPKLDLEAADFYQEGGVRHAQSQLLLDAELRTDLQKSRRRQTKGGLNGYAGCSRSSSTCSSLDGETRVSVRPASSNSIYSALRSAEYESPPLNRRFAAAESARPAESSNESFSSLVSHFLSELDELAADSNPPEFQGISHLLEPRRKSGMGSLMQTQYELFVEGANNTRTFLLAARRKKNTVNSEYEMSRVRFNGNTGMSSNNIGDGRKDSSKRKSPIVGSVK